MEACSLVDANYIIDIVVCDMMNLKIFLHNLSHVVLPYLILFIILRFTPNVNVFFVYLVTLAGALSPDLDHLIMWIEYKFKNFWQFIVFNFTASRYRKSLLIFHNVIALFLSILLLPIFFKVNLYVGIYLLAFFSHIFLDFLYDLISVGRISHWKILRRI
jgi:hypothetical protein